MMEEFSVVGKSVHRIDAVEKVTGRAKFAADFRVPGTLHLKILRSTHSHAKIMRIDTSKAERLLGVRAVITGKEAPEALTGALIMDQPPIARDVVRFVGEPVAVVAAETVETAEDALELIDVDYEEMPAVFDVEEAMKSGCPIVVHPNFAKYAYIANRALESRVDRESPNIYTTWKVRQGDVEKGFEEADLVVENRYSLPRIQHCMPETFRADAWVVADGTVNIRSAKQGPYQFRFGILRYLGLPPSKVRHLEAYIGGAYGGRASPVEDCIAGLMAMKTGKPVRLLLSRQEQFSACYSRAPFIIYIKDGVKKDGKLLAREMRVIIDGGAYTSMTPLIVKTASHGATGTYRVANFSWDSYGVYTNNLPSGPFRGFGSPQVTWAIEQQMDIIAGRLGIDPVELRKKNILRSGEKSVVGETTHSIGVRKCLDKVAQWIGWGEPAASVGGWRRGKGIAIGNKATAADLSACVTIKVHPDRVIEVRHGVAEVGQGINTVLAQIAAEEFGISTGDIRVVFGDTAIVPYGFGSASSQCTWHVGLALRRACQDAKQQIFEMAAPKLGVNPNDLETSYWQVHARGIPGKSVHIGDLFTPMEFVPTLGEILGRGQYTSPYVPEDTDGRSPRPMSFYSHGAYGVEVAVNIETGELRVERIAGAFDMGQPINPKMCEQQIEGGMAQGVGHAIYEELLMKDGRVLNPSFTDYRVPLISNIPTCENVKSMIAMSPHKEGPFTAKGLGESVLCPLAPAIANALYNAVGIRIKDLPMTHERVLNTLKEVGITPV